MKPTIECMYSCDGCGVTKIKVNVPARGEEDVKQWLDQVCIQAIGRDHAGRSPHCRANKIKDLYIPIADTPDAKIGGLVQRNPGVV